MKPLHRIALVLALAEVAVIATAAARHASHPRADRGGPGGCGSRSAGPHDRSGHRGRPHAHDREHASRRGPAGGPPPWVRERLAAWHREQHAGDDHADGHADRPESEASDTSD